MSIEYKTAEGITTEEYAKENFYFKVIFYGKTHLGKTHGAVSAYRLDRGKPNKIFIIPTDSVQNVEEVLKSQLTEKELNKDIIIPRDESGAMVSFSKYKEIFKSMRELQKIMAENPENHYIIIVDTIDGIEDIYIDSYISTLTREPNQYDYGRGRTKFKNEVYNVLMRMKADVFLISGEQDVYPTTIDPSVKDDGYLKPLGITVPAIGGGNLTTKDKFLRPINLIFNLQKRFITDKDRMSVVNVIEKIKLYENAKEWFKPITLTGFDCNVMPRIFDEIQFRQKQLREEKK